MKYDINLLPPKEQNSVDRLIYFSFHYLRYILVITQLVVIFVFFYRFKVDQEIVDLKDSLRQKEEIVKVASAMMRDSLVVEQKIKHVKTVLDQQKIDEGKLDYVLNIFPEALFLTKLSIDEGNLILEGSTQNAYAVQQFYERLQKDKKFTSVTLGNIKRSETVFIFVISLGGFT